MKFLVCIIAFYVWILYMSALGSIAKIVGVIIENEPDQVDLLPFWGIVWLVIFASLLYGKVKHAPLLKPAFKIAVIMAGGFHLAYFIVNLSIETNNSVMIALFAVFGFLAVIITRVFMSIHFYRNPI